MKIIGRLINNDNDSYNLISQPNAINEGKYQTKLKQSLAAEEYRTHNA